MKKFKNIKILCLVLCCTFLTNITVLAEVNNGAVYPVSSNEIPGWPQALDIAEETAVLIEKETGTVLYNKGMNEQRYPASITKIMTAMLIIENANLTDQITFTEEGIKDAYDGSSNIGMQAGEIITVEQSLYAIMLKSANEVAAMAGIYVGGTLENFVQMMNDKAAELGCQNTHFSNANGLFDGNHYTTAYDMALISREAIKSDIFRQVIKTESYTIEPTNMNPNSRTFANHHNMLLPGDYHYDGVYGGKTGYTDESQSTLVTYANRNDMDLIAVVMRGDGAHILTSTAQLFDYGFNNFQKITLDTHYEILSGTSFIMAPKNLTLSDLTENVQQSGDTVTLSYTYGGNALGTVQVTKESYDLVLEQKHKEEEEAAKKEATANKGSTVTFFGDSQNNNASIVIIAQKILIGIVVICVILYVVVLVRNHIHRAKRRKRRKNREKKREE